MAPERRWRMLVVDDHAMMRAGIRQSFESGDQPLEIAAEAADGESAIAQALLVKPDLIVLDLWMRGLGGLEVAMRLKARLPRARVIVYSEHGDPEEVVEAFAKAEVAAYVLKDDPPEALLQAVAAVRAGKRFISPSIAPFVLDELRRAQIKGKLPQLTQREREVLKMVGEGATAKMIAARLKIAPKTVQIHRANLSAKLGVKGTAAMVRYAIKHRLIRLD